MVLSFSALAGPSPVPLPPALAVWRHHVGRHAPGLETRRHVASRRPVVADRADRKSVPARPPEGSDDPSTPVSSAPSAGGARLPAPVAASQGRRRRSRRWPTSLLRSDRVDCADAVGLVRAGWATGRGPDRRCGTRSRTCSSIRRVPARYRGWSGRPGGGIDPAPGAAERGVRRGRGHRAASRSPQGIGPGRRPPAGGTVLGMSAALLARGPWAGPEQSREHLVAEPGEESLHRGQPPVRHGAA